MNLDWTVNLVLLAFCSIQDIREKEISWWKLIVYGLFAAGISIFKLCSAKDYFSVSLYQLFAGLIPGIFLLILAKLSHEAIGYGDGIILLFIGISLGFWDSLVILTLGLFGVFLTAVFAALLLGRSKGLQIPFIPFLFTGMAGGYFWLRG